MGRYNINQLLTRLLLGMVSDEERAELEKCAQAEDIQEIMEADDLVERYNYYTEADENQALSEIQERMAQTHSRPGIHHPYFYRIAAAILILLVGGAFWYHREYTRVTPPVITERVQLAMEQSRESGKEGADILSSTVTRQPVISVEECDLYHVDEDFVEQLTEAKRITTYHNKEYWVTLDDGTLVHLNYNSRLIYPEKFGDRRDVILDGEAYFMVAKDKSRQFVVHTPQGDVKVYGTEFVVNTRHIPNENNENEMDGTSDGTTTVVLVSGRIGFTSANGMETILKPGQKLSFHNNQLSVKEVDVASYVAWNEGEFVFADTPLEDLIATMSRWYQVDVEFANEEARHMLFTGTIDRYGSADVILHSISKVTGLVIEKKGNHVIIK